MSDNQADSLVLEPGSNPAEVQESAEGFVVVDQSAYSVLRNNDEFICLGAEAGSAPAVFQFRDQALNALIEHTIKDPHLRAQIMAVTLDHRRKIAWSPEWIAASQQYKSQHAIVAETGQPGDDEEVDGSEHPYAVQQDCIMHTADLEAV